MTRVGAQPIPSKRELRRQQAERDWAMSMITAALLAGNPVARRIVQHHVDILTSDRMRRLTRTVAWRLGRFPALDPSAVTWPTRRRRHRRTR